MSSQHLRRLPLEVDPFRLAMKEEQFQGVIPLKQMKRLASALSSDATDEEVIEIDVIFSVDTNRVTQLSGKIKTDVKLICQRCMGSMTYPINFDFATAFVRSESEMDHLPEGYDTTLIEDTPVMLSDIIEEEILLVLPAIPKHANEDCSSENALQNWNDEQEIAEDTENMERENPFDILASLKTDK